ncbi:MAG: DegV family protein [Candidatus Competibacteraceae bacterium]|nr:DegV family protein [Candidatus Competibacteraceae bacterium]
MKTVVVIDATCDLPDTYVQQHRLRVLPNKLILGDQAFSDVRDINLSLAFFHRYSTSPDLKATSEPCSTDAIATLFLDRWIVEYDRAILITLSQTLSALFRNATEAYFAILRGYREKRRLAGLLTPFHLNVLDSRTVFAGEAVLADAMLRLLRDQDLAFNELRRRIEEFRRYVRCYILPGDLAYTRNWARDNEEMRVAFPESHLDGLLGNQPVARFFDGEIELAFKGRGFDKALSKLLDHVRKTVELGLKTPLVAISYAGDPQVLRQKPYFVEFERYSRQWGIEVMVSIMSATGGASVGPGALSLAYAAD